MPFPIRLKTKRTRPCGPRDARRKGHRCHACRRARVSCDGGRPCVRCQLRWVPCAEPDESTDMNNFVFLRQPNSPTIPSDHEARHVRSFFTLMKPGSSVLTEPFAHSIQAHFLDSSPPVRLLISSIGRVRLHCMEAKSDTPAIKTLSWVHEIRHNIHRHLQEANTVVDLSSEARYRIILLTVLSCIFELMIDDSGYGAMLVLHSLPTPIIQSVYAGPPCSRYETGLLAVYQYFQATASIVCDRDTFLADILHRERAFKVKMYEDVDLTAAHRVTQFMALFARCNDGSIRWLTQARGILQASLPVEPTPTSIQEVLETSCLESGKNIFKHAHELLNLVAEICPSPQVTPFDHPDFSLFLKAFCHCATISVVRLFVDPLWTCVGRPPAIDEIPHLEFRALAALSILERRLLSVGAECLFYLPLMLVIALEARQPEDKRRVMNILDVIASKGFVVAKTYKSDIQLAWSVSESGFANPVVENGSQISWGRILISGGK